MNPAFFAALTCWSNKDSVASPEGDSVGTGFFRRLIGAEGCDRPLGGKVAVGEIDGRIGAFHGLTAGLLGLFDDVVVAS